MIGGYEDLRNELSEIFGGNVDERDIDSAVEALINKDRTTATAALGELDSLAQSEGGKTKLRDMLGAWIVRERQAKHESKAAECEAALSHLMSVLRA